MQLATNLNTGGWPKHRKSCHVERNYSAYRKRLSTCHDLNFMDIRLVFPTVKQRQLLDKLNE